MIKFPRLPEITDIWTVEPVARPEIIHMLKPEYDRLRAIEAAALAVHKAFSYGEHEAALCHLLNLVR